MIMGNKLKHFGKYEFKNEGKCEFNIKHDLFAI